MAKKQFKAESKKLMDLMINSIYTNKEIFLRELISNASDAIDKLHYRSLTDSTIEVDKSQFKITISVDKEARTLTISDNGCGMSQAELEENLGTIAKSGSFDFKNENEHKKDIDIIGQFGVGFYSSFMVAQKVQVISRKFNEENASLWESEGVNGYTLESTNKETYGTDIILTLKEDTEEENYAKYLEEYTIRELVKKYSDYITYPIQMEVEKKTLKEGTKDEYEIEKKMETFNSLVPLWKKEKKKIKDEEYQTFYSDKFFDYEKPLKWMHVDTEGTISYSSILFIPSHAPFDYYTKEFEKGLQLYSNGVLIMEKCSDLLPDYFSFVKGVVDSSDLSLNISRETLQQERKLQVIAKNIESKIHKELLTMQKEAREDYIKFFQAFGNNIKFGIYNSYGMNNEKLQDLLMFASSHDEKLTTLEEYISRLQDGQEKIYYACGESISKVSMLPQVEAVKEKGYEILYLTDYVDEFTISMLHAYKDKHFVNVCSEEADLASEEEKAELNKKNEDCKELFTLMKEAIGEVTEVRFTNKLKNHPVCLSSTGGVSVEMEKVINAMPTEEKVKASTILEINENHEIAKKIETLAKENPEELKNYSKILYAQARLIEGLPIENPTEISNLILSSLAK